MPLRLSDEQFDTIIESATTPKGKTAIRRLNDEEKEYLRRRAEGMRKGEIATKAVSNLRTIASPEEQAKGQATEGRGLLEGSFFNPSVLKESLKDYRKKVSRSQAETGSVMLPPLVDPQEARQAGIGPVKTAFANVPTSAANMVAGLGEMAMTGAEAGGKLLAGSALTLAGKPHGEMTQEGMEAVSQLTGMVGDTLIHGFINVPKAGLKFLGYGLADAFGLEAYAVQHGVMPDELVSYFEEDPVGTMLFLLPFLKGSAQLKLNRAKAAETGKIGGKPWELEGDGVIQGGTLDRAKALPRDPTAVIESLADFREVPGKPIPEAHYVLKTDVGNKKAGSVASASYLRSQGFTDLGLQLDRRVKKRPTDQEFWNKAADIYAGLARDAEVGGKKLSAEEHAGLWDLAVEMDKEFFRAEATAERADRARVVEQYGLTEESVGRYFYNEEKFSNLAGEEVTKKSEGLKKIVEIILSEEKNLAKSRDSRVDAVRPPEIASVMKRYPQAWKWGRETIARRLEQASRVKSAATWSNIKQALYDEMQLIMPEITRREIKALNKKWSDVYASSGSLIEPEVAWMVDQIASARAKRGQSNTPVTTPVGSYKNSDHAMLSDLGDRVAAFWKEEIAAGDELAKPTAMEVYRAERPSKQLPRAKPGVSQRLAVAGQGAEITRSTGIALPGEKAPVEFSGTVAGVEMWTLEQDMHGFPAGQKVTTRWLTERGYEIERPEFPKATGKERAKGVDGVSTSELAVEDAVQDTLPDHVRDNVIIQEDVKKVGSLISNFVSDITSPILSPLKRLGKGGRATHEVFTEWASSAADAAVRATLYETQLNSMLSGAGRRGKRFIEASKTKYAKYLHDQKRQAALQRQEEAGLILTDMESKRQAGIKLTETDKKNLKWAESTNVDTNIPEMDPQVLAEFKASSEFAIIDKWYRKSVMPFIEGYADSAGITSRMYTPDGLYVKSSYVTNMANFVGDFQKLDFVSSEFGRAGGTVYGRAKTKARAARTFRGVIPEGMVVNQDLGSIIHETFRDRMTSSGKRRSIEEMHRWDHYSRSKRFRPNQRVTDPVTGDSYTLVEVQGMDRFIDGPGVIIREKVLVPKEVADGFLELADNKPDTTIQAAVRNVQGFMTGLALLTPAEATMHALNVLHAASRLAGEGLGQNISAKLGSGTLGKTADFLVTYGTQAGRIGGLFYDMMGMSQAELTSYTKRLSKVGGLRTYGIIDKKFQPARQGTAHKALQWAHDIPGMSSIRDSVFGMPTKGKGLSGLGLETRMRISVFKALEKMEPGKGDAYYAEHLNNFLGTYSTKLVPKITQHLMTVDPFARAGTGMAKTAFSTLGDVASLATLPGKIGDATFSLRSYSNGINATMTVFAIAAIVKSITGAWPWDKDNSSLSPGDIPIPLEDGRRLDIPFAKLFNNLYRGMKYTGIIDAGKLVMHGENDPATISEEVVKSWLNFGLSRLGPPIRAMWQGATLETPYLVSGPGEGMQFMKVTEPTRDAGDRLFNHLKAGLQPMLPVLSKMPGSKDLLGVRDYSEKPRTVGGQIARIATETLGFTTYLRGEDYEHQVAGFEAQSAMKMVQSTAQSIYAGAKRLPEHQRGEYISRELVDRFPSPEERLRAVQIMIGMGSNEANTILNRVLQEEAMKQGAPGHLLPKQ